jgi:aldehyde dehydrogenase (NAD+)
MFGQTVPSELRNKFAMSVRQPLGRQLDHHAVEFSDGDPIVEDHSGAGLWQHRRVQTGVADAAVGAELRQGARGRGSPKGVVNMVTGDGDEVGTPLTTHATCEWCRSPDPRMSDGS